MSGLGVATTAGSALGDEVWFGSAATGLLNERIPAARKATPAAVRRAGMIRVRIRSARNAIGPAW